MTDLGSKTIDYVPPEGLSPLDYKADIEKHYKILATDELRRIVRNYKAKSPYARMFETNKAEKTGFRVAAGILRERKILHNL